MIDLLHIYIMLVLVTNRAHTQETLDPCVSSPCGDYGMCTPTETLKAYTCKCFSGWSGANCDQKRCTNNGECSSFNLGILTFTAAPLIIATPVIVSIIIMVFYIYLSKISKLVSSIKCICAKPTTHPSHSQIIYSISSNYSDNPPLSYDEAILNSVLVQNKAEVSHCKKDILPSYNEVLKLNLSLSSS